MAKSLKQFNHLQKLNKDKIGTHHTDYNKKNNNPNNLISLCSSCNIQANFSRKDWSIYFKNKLLKV